MGKKINVGILFGGKSVEHEVSLQSAKNVVAALDKNKYNVHLIGIDKEGKWHLYEEKDYLVDAEDPEAIALGSKKDIVELLHEPKTCFGPIDVIFPILHGSFGEDGTVQGFLKLANIPFVGPDVTGAAIGMDKDVMKRLIREANIPTTEFFTLHQHERHLWPFEKVVKKISLPFFVKPASSGSSIGIHKVNKQEQFDEAVEKAFNYDRKILIEKAVVGREIECSLLGNEYPIVSLPCEIVPSGEFHSYASKYVDPEGAEFIIPVELKPDELSRVQKTALDAYKVLCCEGFARIDLFLKPDGEVLFNEINTIPGLTNMSPYNKMWEATGLPFPELLDRLIQLALDRFEKQKRLQTTYEVKVKSRC